MMHPVKSTAAKTSYSENNLQMLKLRIELQLDPKKLDLSKLIRKLLYKAQ